MPTATGITGRRTERDQAMQIIRVEVGLAEQSWQTWPCALEQRGKQLGQSVELSCPVCHQCLPVALTSFIPWAHAPLCKSGCNPGCSVEEVVRGAGG